METIKTCEFERESGQYKIYKAVTESGKECTAFQDLKPGTEVTITEKDYKGEIQYVAKPVKQNNPGNYQRGKQQGLHPSVSLATMCLSYCKDLVIADKITFEQMLPSADKMYNWAKGKEG